MDLGAEARSAGSCVHRADLAPTRLPRFFADILRRRRDRGRGTRRIRMTLQLPEGARRMPTAGERYDEPDPRSWFPAALDPGSAPVDLSFLNRDDRPAGRRGFVRADGDRLVFADGSPARFWGGNLAAYSLFLTPARRSPARPIGWPGSATTSCASTTTIRTGSTPNVFGRNAADHPPARPPGPSTASTGGSSASRTRGSTSGSTCTSAASIKPGDGLTEGADEVARQRGQARRVLLLQRPVAGVNEGVSARCT